MKKCLLLLSLLAFASLYAQEFKTGKIDESLFSKELTQEQREAPAVFLEKYRETNFEYRDNLDGWTVFTTIHNVIKILDVDGLEYGTKQIHLVHQGREEEKIDRIEAYSYTMENGKVQRDKMERSAVIENKLTEQLDEKILIIPSVQVGDIIEYSYRLESTYWNINDLIIEEDIPVKHAYAKIAIPQFFDYNVYVKGSIEVAPKLSVGGRAENFSAEDKNSFGGRTQRTDFVNIKFKENISEFEFIDVPSLTIEPFVNNIDNYRGTILWELGAVEMNRGERINRAKTWDQVANFFYEQLEIGEDLERTNFLDEVAKNIKATSNTKEKMINNAYRFIQESITWNKLEYNYKKINLRKAFKEGSGSAYEINMLLVALLQKLNLNSSPIMASTKGNGVPLYPTVGGFNYVLVGVVQNEEWLVMDATEKNAIPGLLPERIMNWEGRLVKQNGTSKGISLFSKDFSQKKAMIIASVDPSGEITGKMRWLYTNNEALKFTNSYKRAAARTQEALLTRELNVDEVSDINFKFQPLDKPSSVSFSFVETSSELIGKKMYIKPQLFLSKVISPFTQEKRRHTIDLSYPLSIENAITLNIPPSYSLESMPETAEISLPDNLGTYRLKFTKSQGKSVQVLSTLTLNTTLIAPESYTALKDFYSEIVAKEKETIVLIKS